MTLLISSLTSCEYNAINTDFNPKDPIDPIEPSYLYEDFEAVGLNMSKWGYSWNSTTPFPPQPTLVSVSSGKLRLDYLANSGAWECPSIHSTRTFDLRDHFVIYEMASATPGIMAEAGIIVDDTHMLSTEMTGGVIRSYHRDPGGDTYSAALAFDPTAKFIRIRHQTSDDTYYVEFSSDKLSWTSLHSVAAYAGFDPAAVEIVMGACHTGSASNDNAQYSAVFTDAQ